MCSLRWNGAMAAENLAPAAPSAQLPVASDLSPLQRPAVRDLIFSRAATMLGMSTLSYGAMVFLAQEGASQFVVSLAGATRYLAAVLFGLVDQVAPLFAPISSLRPLELFSIALSEGVLAAGLIAIPFSFSTAAGASVQTYLNRQVPLATQGALFGRQELLENLLTLLAILGFGIIAALIGPRFVFVVAPTLVIASVVWLVGESYRRAQAAAPSRHKVVDAMLRLSRTVPSPPLEDGGEPESNREAK
jgi:hypothetical protein